MNDRVNVSVCNRIVARKFSWFLNTYPKKKLIKFINEVGGVLTGSRSMKCYDINGKIVLDRKTNDWDFIITESMAYEIFDEFDIKYDLFSKFISIQGQNWWRHPDYSDSYRVGPVDINLIIVDEQPEWFEVGGYKITNLSYVLSEKIKLIKDINMKNEDKTKHFEDLRQFVVKYNVVKNELL